MRSNHFFFSEMRARINLQSDFIFVKREKLKGLLKIFLEFVLGRNTLLKVAQDFKLQ